MSPTLESRLSSLSRLQRRAPAVSFSATGAEHVHDDSVLHANIDAASFGNCTLVPAANQRIEILEMMILNPAGAQTILLLDSQNSTANTLLRLLNYAAGAGLMLGFSGNGQPHFTMAAGNAFVMNLSVGDQVDGFIKYRLID